MGTYLGVVLLLLLRLKSVLMSRIAYQGACTRNAWHAPNYPTRSKMDRALGSRLAAARDQVRTVIAA